WVSLWPLV
ncbi:aquaporin Z domain protein, partial [Vibrio parahaemolyticus VP2007-007]